MHPDPHFDDPEIRDDPMEYLGEGAEPEQKEAAKHYELDVTNESGPVDASDRRNDEYYYGEATDEEDQPPL